MEDKQFEITLQMKHILDVLTSIDKRLIKIEGSFLNKGEYKATNQIRNELDELITELA